MWLLAILSPSLDGCRAARHSDPAALYQNVRGDLLHGNLDVAAARAENAREQFTATSPEWSMRFRLLEADILSYQGRRPLVIELLESPGVSYPATGDLAIKRDVLRAMADARLGKGPKADAELAQAERLSSASQSPLADEVLRAGAIIQMARNHWPEAADLSRKSLQLARAQHDPFLEAHNLLNLGVVAFQLHHYDETLALLNEAVAFAKPIEARLVLEAAMGIAGAAYYQLGDFEKALADFQQAEEQAQETGITSAQVEWLWNEGSSYYELGDAAAAKRCYEQSLKSANVIKYHEEITGIETDLAFLLFKQGDFSSAKGYTDEAIRLAREYGDSAGELKPRFLQALLAARMPGWQTGEALLIQVEGESRQDPELQAQIENALGNLYAANHRAAQAERWYRQSIHTFEEQRASLSEDELRLPFFANGDALYRDYATFLIASKEQQKALQLLDLSRAKTLAEGLGSANQSVAARQQNAVDQQSVARKLNGVILFYSLGTDKSYMWAVTSQATHLFVLPGQAEIEAKVEAHQKSILRSSDPLRDASQNASDLYDMLLSPAAPMMATGARIFVIPDGVLNELNFETILVPRLGGAHYWIEDVTVSDASSIRLLSRLDSSPAVASPKKLLLVGNPTAAGTGYDTLMNAFAEIRGIEKHFPSDSETVITQASAIPAAYSRNNPDQYQYIHFVAHGTASRLSPLDSAVVLSPSPGDPESFKLYARDIMHHPLRAQLVTISACFGSGLRAYAGEGLVGLSWAFLRAGAHNVIGALWEVNDASTPLLMDRLYTELAAGSAPEAALRTAKLSLIHSQAVYRKPLYWAAFQLYTGS